MNISLKYEEGIVFALKSLYSRYGYRQFKMKKFEEYDLYAKNKDFLISENIVTFTDTNGKLMALKPDVTLSIVKNSRDLPGYVDKLYYNENVYRVSKGTRTFKEIMQVGLECIGDVDELCISEVITLAAKSLKVIDDSAVLCISHFGMLGAVLDYCGIGVDLRGEIIRCIEKKNEHELRQLCEENAVDGNNIQLIAKLISLYGRADEVLPKLESLCTGSEYMAAFDGFRRILDIIDDDVKQMLLIDFSVISDAKYYNGILFKGFIEKIPESVLSGGQYDSLMERMNKSSKAIGFAVYMDVLDPLKTDEEEFEQDIVLLYDESEDIRAVKRIADSLIARGSRVSAQRCIPNKLTYRQLMKIRNGEVEIIEKNA